MKRLIILRPEPGASESVNAARQMGLDALAIPLFRIEPVAWTAPDAARFDGLLFTSANAVRHGGDQLYDLRGLKAYCVGEATAVAAREAGFDIAAAGDSGVERLLGSIEKNLRLLHLAGQHRNEAGEPPQEITAIPVYASVELPAPEQIGKAEQSVVAIHSSRAAARFAQLVEEEGLDRSTIALVAISAAVGKEAGQGWSDLRSVQKPNDPSLLALAQSMCNTAQT